MKGIKKRLAAYLESLRFPWLLLATSAVFLVDLFLPDAIPFVDEMLLALLAVLLGRLKRKTPRAAKP